MTVSTEPSEHGWFGPLATGRRAVLAVLVDRSGPADLADLARALGVRDEGRSEPTTSAARSAAISLYHADISKLAESGLLVYDHGRGEVEPTPALLDSAAGR